MTRMQRLKDAIEGECDGLAITDDHARAILEFLDAEGAQAKPAEAGWIHAAFASYWWAKKDYTADPRQIAETAFHAGAALAPQLALKEGGEE